MMRFASIKQLEIIGESANHISDSLKQKYSDIQWKEIIGLRNILIHEYFGVDVNVIWTIITVDIPKLENAITRILKDIE